jgi:1-acyl-sn-glycerol-3-phosphate acyltransferase
MSIFSRIYGVIGVTFCAVAAFLMLILTGIPLMLVPHKHRWKFGIWTNVWLAWTYLHLVPLFCRVEKKGLEHIPRDRGFLAIVNHRSAVDIPLVIVDTRAQGISKQAVLYFPGMGQMGYLGGALFFRRKSPGSRRRVLKRAVACMKGGQALHVYPQGTRVRDGREVRVHLGLVEACYLAGIPVLPTALMYTERVMSNDISMRPFQKVKISYLPLVEPADFADSKVFAQACWRQVLEEADRLLDKSTL